ncbi:carbon-nitrogen hydrolase family protein [Dysosmobacter sp.]
MANYNWSAITKENVLTAIHSFLQEYPEYPDAKNTFLLYDGRKLPAKHIRGLAYKAAFGIEVPKSDYSGGWETAQFFKKLGFEIQYSGETNKEPQMVAQNGSLQTEHRKPLRIAMYLQTEAFQNEEEFEKAVSIVSEAGVDILVFPENCYTPFTDEFLELDPYDPHDSDIIVNHALALSKRTNCAVVVSSCDKFGSNFSVFANGLGVAGETESAIHTKHTMTYCSAFEFQDYRELDWFKVIAFRGYRIGLTICYDCNHAVFSRMYGLQGVDILLNSTGGDVVYDKWFKYNQARSLENSCYSFVTMGGSGEGKNPKSHVYGFSPTGKALEPVLLNGQGSGHNVPGGIYIFTLDTTDDEPTPDSSLDQRETENKKAHLYLPVGKTDQVLSSAQKISDHLYVEKKIGRTIVYCVVCGEDIFKPEIVIPLLYDERLEQYSNKCFIIVNKFPGLTRDVYEEKLSLILKVRAMENFCAVILESEHINHCYQTGNNRTAQVVQAINGSYGIDLDRTSCGDAIWRNKLGGQMKAVWRCNYEWLVRNMDMLATRSVKNDAL